MFQSFLCRLVICHAPSRPNDNFEAIVADSLSVLCYLTTLFSGTGYSVSYSRIILAVELEIVGKDSAVSES
jgi:hypothetical protein